MSKNGFIFPKDRGENKNMFELPPPKQSLFIGKLRPSNMNSFPSIYTVNLEPLNHDHLRKG